MRVGAPKASMRTYYYLDYSHAIDVIKWRMYKIQNEIDKKLRNVCNGIDGHYDITRKLIGSPIRIIRNFKLRVTSAHGAKRRTRPRTCSILWIYRSDASSANHRDATPNWLIMRMLKKYKGARTECND